MTAPSIRSLRRLLVVAAAAVVIIAAPTPGAEEPAAAQPVAHSDWIPFVGEIPIGCTAATGNPGDGFCGSHHAGWAVDFNMEMDFPIYATGPGEVAWIDGGCAPAGGDAGGACNNRAGNYVAVDHGDHISRYIHLASFAQEFEVGDPIVGGQLIGYAGNSGTTGSGLSHLHYDEISHPISVTQRIFFGPMLACHGDTPVQYPDVLGTTDWQAIPWGTILRNDGYECLGGVTPEAPPAPAPLESSPGGSPGLAMGDLDGDGYADLLVGIPGEDIKSKRDAGKAAVAYGSDDGLGGKQQLRQGKRKLKGSAESGDMLGAAVATGDFDCDGRADVAVGAPGEDVGSIRNAGVVSIGYGNGNDVDNRAVTLRQNRGTVTDEPEAGDLFGASLATGDFDGDGCDDLAVGVPGEDVGSIVDAGAVMVTYGATGGIDTGDPAEPLLYQDAGFAGFTEARDFVGAALASGDFDCDGYDDLAAGAPGEAIDAMNNAGAVSITWGGPNGLGGEPVTLYQSSGVTGILERGDRLGTALAAGDFDGDGCDDLAIGAPSEDLDGGRDAGAVSVSYGSPEGLESGSVHYQDDGGLAGTIDPDDNVGAALVAGDFDCDGDDDLAVGAPGEDIDGATDTGWVGVLEGSPSGIQGTTTSWSQGSGLPGRDETGDRLGSALASGDIDGDGCDDLAIGVPGEGFGSKRDAGRVIVVQGGSSGPTGTSNWSQSRGGLGDKRETGDELGGPGVWHLLGVSLQ